MTNILSIAIILIQILLLTLDWWDGTTSNVAFFYVATAVCAGAIRKRSEA